ncbi:MAG: glutamate--cysteine ligase [Gammaproteobacteria bacterium]|nr:glutamate--cysteine ligase [Gammaproteobacteria bacterium]
MADTLVKRIQGLHELDRPDIWQGSRKGLEKESLRLDPLGRLAQTPHPKSLGAALTNRFITTDYSEALMELVTPAMEDSAATRQFLCDIHQYVYDNLGDEMLWPASMPCGVNGEESVPIAEYGSSNIGQMKHVYRRGLGHRYGRMMQVIAGVHFNFSFSEDFWKSYQELLGSDLPAREFRDQHYMGLIRNFHRIGWLVLYLFGASPALCKSFLRGRDTDLQAFDENSFFRPYATSLRMSDLGYKNQAQSALRVSVNSLPEYLRDLDRAVSTPYADYQRIGVEADGEYRQLNANLLQIENEYYSLIRPKRVIESGQRPGCVLAKTGVQYVEVRALDLNVFDPAGVSETQMRFLEAMLLYCLLHESPPIEDAEYTELGVNQGRVAERGRQPGLELIRDGQDISLKTWAGELLEGISSVCKLLDQGFDKPLYMPALAAQQDTVRDPENTPSARVLREMQERGESFLQFGSRWARRHGDYFHGLQRCDPGRVSQFVAEASASVARQRDIERKDSISFKQYLEEYFSN